MKQVKKQSVLWILLFLFSSLYATAESWEIQEEKKVSNSYNFNVSASDQLAVDNSFGNITITYWNKKAIDVRVDIETRAKTAQRAQELLDLIKVTVEKKGNTVSAVTSMKNPDNTGGNNQSFTINYYITLPSDLSMNLSQKFGNITLPKQNDGKCKLVAKYGNIKAGSFSKDLAIDIQFGNLNIENIEKATIDASYSGDIKMGDIKDGKMDLKYSNLTAKNAQKLVVDNKYGNIKLESAENLAVDLKYGNGEIGLLKQELKMDIGYSNLDIKELSDKFSRVAIDAQFSTVNLKVPVKTSFNVKASRVKYGKYNITGFNEQTEKLDNNSFSTKVNGGNDNRSILFDGKEYSNLSITTAK